MLSLLRRSSSKVAETERKERGEGSPEEVSMLTI
jgi:hypothetical protein